MCENQNIHLAHVEACVRLVLGGRDITNTQGSARLLTVSVVSRLASSKVTTRAYNALRSRCVPFALANHLARCLCYLIARSMKLGEREVFV